MQQTENLNLNLIEGSDTVDWVPLNENFEALEQETADIRTNMADGLAELAGSIETLAEETATAIGSGGSNARVICGIYTATGSAQTLVFPFKPVIVFLTASANTGGSDVAVLIRADDSENDDSSATAAWGTNSVTITSVSFNAKNRIVYYAAIGIPE